MELIRHDISTQVSSKVWLEDVGHVTVCDDMIVSKDMESSGLKLVQEDFGSGCIVVSFTIAGDQIIYLQEGNLRR